MGYTILKGRSFSAMLLTYRQTHKLQGVLRLKNMTLYQRALKSSQQTMQASKGTPLSSASVHSWMQALMSFRTSLEAEVG